MKAIQNDSAFFTKTMFYRFLIPAVFSSLAIGAGNVVDALVVGISMGETGLAAIAFATPLFAIYNVLDVGLATGGSIAYGKLLGEGRHKEGITLFNMVVVTALILGALVGGVCLLCLKPIMLLLGVTPADGEVYTMAVSYARILLLAGPLFFLQVVMYSFVRADDGQRIAAVGFVAGNVTDFALNFVFVLGFKMGVSGAILATVCGCSLSVCIYLFHIFRKASILRFQFFKYDFSGIRSSFRTGFASSSRYIFQFILFMFMNNLMMWLGGIDAMAVYSLTINISYLTCIASDAAVATLEPLSATFMGERNKPAMTYTLKMSMLFTLLATVIIGSAISVFALPLCKLFGIGTALALSWGPTAVRIMCISAVFGNLMVTYCTFFQATGRETPALLTSMLRNIVFMALSALVCGVLFGPAGVWWMYLLNELATAALIIILVRSVKKWRVLPIDESLIVTRLVDGSPEQISELAQAVEAFAEEKGASPLLTMRVTLMIEEICSMIAENGYQYLDSLKEKAKKHRSKKWEQLLSLRFIEVTVISLKSEGLEIHFRDNAERYNIFAQDDDDIMGNPADRIIKKNADEHFYRQYQGFNTLTVTVNNRTKSKAKTKTMTEAEAMLMDMEI